MLFRSVISVLQSDFLTQGPKINNFELEFAKYVGSKYAVAVSNGTAALHLATLALGLKQGDKVITTPITFAATANCIKYCGGEVVFSDIDSKTYLLDIAKVRILLESAPKGTYKGIIPVDFAGRAVNLEEFKNLAKEYNLWIIEDACHAPGGHYFDSSNSIQKCGSSKFSDLSIFSFHAVKHITTGEGGMITTNDPKLYQKLLELRTHGITKEPKNFVNNLFFANSELNENSYPGWYMEMQTLGFNYRITDFQAALGITQVKRANDGLVRRRYIAKKYNDEFSDQNFLKGHSGFIEGHAYHLYIIEIENRLGLYNYLKKHNILTQVHYIPCHLMPYYKELGWKEGDLPNAENYYKSCLSIPMFPSISDDEINFVIKTIKDFYE